MVSEELVGECLGLTELASFGGGIAPNRVRRRTGQPPMRLAGRSPAAEEAKTHYRRYLELVPGRQRDQERVKGIIDELGG